jgi:hypothetical protein
VGADLGNVSPARRGWLRTVQSGIFGPAREERRVGRRKSDCDEFHNFFVLVKYYIQPEEGKTVVICIEVTVVNPREM